MTFYIRGRCEDGTVYAWVDRGKIKGWHSHIEDATAFETELPARQVVGRHQTDGWVYQIRTVER